MHDNHQWKENMMSDNPNEKQEFAAILLQPGLDEISKPVYAQP